jgi:hypothetical protein
MKKTNITLSIALAAVFSSSVAFAEAEVTGKIVHESAKFTNAGIGIGAATTSTQTANTHDKDVFKTETSARIYIDGEIDQLQEGAAYHVELNLMTDSKGVGKYDSNESYTQRDALREAYIDLETNGYSIRAGKQQVVWGTADGMKLLDAINPTDYSEMAQNQMEDSRIPVWMINAETDTTSGGNWQVILSEGRSSIFAGMGTSSDVKRQVALDGTAGTKIFTEHSNGDQGHAFMMKGADTITGQVNGFLNIVPALGAVAEAFRQSGNSSGMAQASVNDFMLATNAGGVNQAAGFGAICNTVEFKGTNLKCMDTIVNTNKTAKNGYSGANNKYAQNLISGVSANTWDAGKDSPTEVFHYMPDASFATFDQFVGAGSKFVVDHDIQPTISARYKDSRDGLNYSLNVIHGKDTNPYVSLHWEDQNGNKLAETVSNTGVYYTNNLGDGTTVGGSAGGVGGTAASTATFVMTEQLNTITQLGSSFDTAIETGQFGPIVLRGEALYQKDVMSPIVTRKDSTGKDLNHGFLASSMVMTKGDRFKYVLGADITALTNMMVSVQFIQDMNLDYVDVGNKDATNWKYTGDMATMSLTNNLNKAEENKEFYSIFLSKPFGASGEHRWNNIFMFEEGDGMWNRLDAEFSIDDDTQATVEYNKYWGDENTQFGQLEKSSNVQVGVKYSF